MGGSEQSTTRRIERIGLIGDVHTERARLAGVLKHFATLGLDAVLCTGDLPDGPGSAGDVDACVRLLQEHGVLTIAGNHDRWLLDGEMRDLTGATEKHELAPETLAFLSRLPMTREFDSPSGRVLLCHGMGADDMATVQPHDHGLALEDNDALQRVLRMATYRCVMSGHSHRATQRTLGNVMMINAGTLLTGQGPCCTVADLHALAVQVYAVDDDGRVSGTPTLRS